MGAATWPGMHSPRCLCRTSYVIKITDRRTPCAYVRLADRQFEGGFVHLSTSKRLHAGMEDL
jgi:hypothetical protein